MKNIFFILLLSVCFISNLPSQSYFGKNAIIGTGLAPIWSQTGDGQLDYFELSWEKNVSVRITKHFYVGLNHIDIYAKHISPPSWQRGKLKNFIVGGFSEFRIPLSEKFSLTAHAGYYLGNHCTCHEENPIQIDDLSYLSIGTGLDHRLIKNLFVTARLRNFFILQDLEEKFYHVSIFGGIEYRFGRK